MSYVTAFGTGPQRLRDYLADNWQATRTDRPDLPPATKTERSQQGTVYVVNDRGSVNINKSVHDLIHIYHPQADPINIEDRGFKEQNVQENIQIDIECTDRVDPDTGQRNFAKQRMVGDRSDPDFTDSGTNPTYPGLLGETIYLLEAARLGLDEWDVTDHTVIRLDLGNSQADVSLDVTLEHISANTNQ